MWIRGVPLVDVDDLEAVEVNLVAGHITLLLERPENWPDRRLDQHDRLTAERISPTQGFRRRHQPSRQW